MDEKYDVDLQLFVLHIRTCIGYLKHDSYLIASVGLINI